MRLSPPAAVCACAALVFSLARCSGCSQECAGDNAGSAGCSCGSDQDCTTRLGKVLLCVDGTCAQGDPEDAPGDACAADADCGGGEACGIDGICLPAPSCQRIDVALQAHKNGGALGADVTAARDDCAHDWQAEVSGESFHVTFTLDLSGDMKDFSDPGGGGCTAGHWSAGDRVGEILCGVNVFAVGPADVVPCFLATGACDVGTCRAVAGDTEVGVCR